MKKVIPFILLCFSLLLAKADSPLTSTEFWRAYKNESIIQYTKDVGVMDKKIAKFLMDEKNNIGLKVAVCNVLSWNIDGQNNANLLFAFISKKYHFKPEHEDLDRLNAGELACMGYLTAMDDYFSPQKGLPYLEMAVEKERTSLAIQIVNALVEAQVAFESDWCAVFTLVHEVSIDDHLKADFLHEAEDIIMEYINLYEENCQ